jgi:hypothetical protein
VRSDDETEALSVGSTRNGGIVIDMRRRWSHVKGFTRRLGQETRSRLSGGGGAQPSGSAAFVADPFEDDATRVWRGEESSDGGGGAKGPGGDADWDVVGLSDDEADEEESAYPVYFHHPDRRSASFHHRQPPLGDEDEEVGGAEAEAAERAA